MNTVENIIQPAVEEFSKSVLPRSRTSATTFKSSCCGLTVFLRGRIEFEFTVVPTLDVESAVYIVIFYRAPGFNDGKVQEIDLPVVSHDMAPRRTGERLKEFLAALYEITTGERKSREVVLAA